jgi:hypothetical protein
MIFHLFNVYFTNQRILFLSSLIMSKKNSHLDYYYKLLA